MIDPRQRYDDPEALFRVAIGAMQAGLWTAMPGIVQAYSAATATVTVRLALTGAVQHKDGTIAPTIYPPLALVPVLFPRGGGCTLTFPIAAGDECLVVFACRAIDWWWQNGGVNNPPAEARMHDLSDGFALIGPFSQATKLANVSTTTARLTSNDGASYVELNAAGHVVNIVAPGGLNITGQVSVTGAVSVSQGITAAAGIMAGQTITSSVDVQAAGISLVQHVHTGVAGGSSNTGPAVG